MADDMAGETTGCGVDSDLELHLAIATYLATYVESNESIKSYFNSLQGESRKIFFDFVEVYMNDPSFDSSFKDEMESICAYRAAMKRIVNGDTRLQMKMLNIRKFFSCPWLICPDLLLRNVEWSQPLINL